MEGRALWWSMSAVDDEEGDGGEEARSSATDKERRCELVGTR